MAVTEVFYGVASMLTAFFLPRKMSSFDVAVCLVAQS